MVERLADRKSRVRFSYVSISKVEQPITVRFCEGYLPDQQVTHTECSSNWQGAPLKGDIWVRLLCIWYNAAVAQSVRVPPSGGRSEVKILLAALENLILRGRVDV